LTKRVSDLGNLSFDFDDPQSVRGDSSIVSDPQLNKAESNLLEKFQSNDVKQQPSPAKDEEKKVDDNPAPIQEEDLPPKEDPIQNFIQNASSWELIKKIGNGLASISDEYDGSVTSAFEVWVNREYIPESVLAEKKRADSVSRIQRFARLFFAKKTYKAFKNK
jgi:hypothetical protein